MYEINKEKWTKALADYSNHYIEKNVGVRIQALSRLMQIKNTSFEEISKSDLALLDDFFTFLDEEEQNKLKEYIKNTFDYVEM